MGNFMKTLKLKIIMETDVNPNEWQVHGRCYDPKASNEYCENSITLPEQISNLGMREHPTKSPGRGSTINIETFGVPIDADLAVHLIKNGLSNEGNILFDQHIKEEVAKKKNDQSENFTLGVLTLLYGITFDKTIVLKILSQPNCEGLRAYLCARIDGEVSLVLVGVDANGFDLNYDPGIGNSKAAQTPTNSLIVEYGYPPGPSVINKKNGEIDNHYVLLKIAANTN
jgi:hypothetical protein